ncbi:hypothetical protein [Natrononativus amylolyticus]|uniref:hypothetical protein n=1 Tax=Natrononativus amylolyticus TaxID=2963434 RepID=UPI0020CD5037|nr:hypothetical protein [Natrononativus amylolyticus]
MKGPGILWMLQTAAGLSMAGPMFIIGLEFTRDGQLVGGVGFFALGVVALYFPTWLLGRIGGPRAWIARRLERRRADDEEAEQAESESERRPGLLERFRSD